MEAAEHFRKALPVEIADDQGFNAEILEFPPVIVEGYTESDYHLAHGTVEVPGAREPVAYTLSVPEVAKDPRVHMFIPGFGGFKFSSRKVRNALAENEQVIGLSYEPSRHGGTRNDLLDAQKVHFDTVEAIIQDLPNNEQLKDTAGGAAIDFNELVPVPHSMGGIPATEYGVKHPDNVAHMIMIAIVGAEGRAMFNFVPRLGRSAKHELAPAIFNGHLGGVVDGGNMWNRAARYYGSNPLRTIGEIKSCFQADRRMHIKALGALGVKTAMYLPEHDQLIPADKSLRAASHLVTYFEVAKGLDHLAPQIQSRRVASDVARISRHLDTL